MKAFGGWQFPNRERILIEYLRTRNDEDLGRLRYQGHKQRAAIALCAQDKRRVMVDVGAHVGLWAWYFAKEFSTVHAYEPVQEHRLCFAHNVRDANVIMHAYALGDVRKKVYADINYKNSCKTWMRDADSGDVTMKLLDDDDLQDVDLIKVDCEGAELLVLKGGASTLNRCHPVIVVEQKPGVAKKRFGLPDKGAITYLESLGAKLRGEMNGDFLLSWDN